MSSAFQNDSPNAQGLQVEWTQVTSGNSPLSKTYKLESGSIKKAAAAQMTSGVAIHRMGSFSDFCSHLESTESQSAFAYGLYDSERFGPEVKVTTKAETDPSKGEIARTKDYFHYPDGPGILMLDHDLSIYESAFTPEKLVELLIELIPEFQDCAYAVKPSNSAGVSVKGEQPSGSGGFHLYIPVQEASDVPRFGQVLFDRLWLAGHGYIALSATGSFLTRSPIDQAVFSPERLDFVGRPVIKGEGLVYKDQPIRIHEGGFLYTALLCDLSDSEKKHLESLQKEAKSTAEIKDKSESMRADWELTHRAKLEDQGASASEIEVAMSRIGVERSDVFPDWLLEFSDGRTATVREVLENPDRYNHCSLADPFEGRSYGASTAIYYWNHGENPVIYSQAHGGHTYFLKQEYHDKEPWEEELEEMVADFNQLYFFSMIQGKSVLISKRYDEQLKCERTIYTSIGGCRDLMRNRLIQTGVKVTSREVTPIFKNHLDAWLSHVDRLSYEHGVVFDPSGITDEKQYNLWTGYPIDPLEGSCETILTFISEIICSGNDEHYEYVLNWLARAIQKPQDIGEVALVLRGKKGCGKTTLGEVMRRIFGNNYLLIDDPNLLTRGFNAHLRECVFAVADEAVFAGDKRTGGKLKSQITSTTMNLERKGYDVEVVPSRLTLVIISNEDHIVDASGDERRYFTLEVSNEFIGNRDYFHSLYSAIKGDEVRCFFNMMMGLDLSLFNHRDIPYSAELNIQQALSLKPIDLWLCEIGHRGYIYDSDLKELTTWHDFVSMDLLMKSIDSYNRQKKVSSYDIATRQQVGKKLKGMFSKGRKKNLIIGERVTDAFMAKLADTSKEQKVGYELGSLEDFRAVLIDNLKLPADYFDED